MSVLSDGGNQFTAIFRAQGVAGQVLEQPGDPPHVAWSIHECASADALPKGDGGLAVTVEQADKWLDA
jgi:hypothetical protein